ncbi:MAG: DUF4364 family protein [Oscillospiraceae bacterium]|nr:DUF4364 family protein [Oscillospiraceae bacterium]
MADNFGFIYERIEIKVLILFVLRRLPEPVTIDVLSELTMCDEDINYFDVVDCIATLVKTKHLHHENEKYSLTAIGRRNGELLEKNIPRSVRTRAEDAAALVRIAQNRDSMIKTERRVGDDGGYKVSLSLSDGVGEVISMELFATNEERASALEKGFRKNAEKIYHNIVKMIAE